MHTALQHHTQLVLEAPGFNYHENRGMAGFIDGAASI
ncbi:MAG: hypothetical protein EXR08_09360 [Alphaproteobacteria bacterium]|nr:hypothetical protein [Alphaproteobacteria bacterium]